MADEDFDPFGWDDDIDFDPDKLEAADNPDDDTIDDIDQIWDYYYDYDYYDFVDYEYEGTGDTGGEA